MNMPKFRVLVDINQGKIPIDSIVEFSEEQALPLLRIGAIEKTEILEQIESKRKKSKIDVSEK